MSYYFYNYGFKVRVPSQLYLNKTEGLCGNCNGNPDDDMCKPKGVPAEDVDQFGLSWLANSLLKNPVEEEGSCQVQPESDCQLLPPDQDPCLKLITNPVFEVFISTFIPVWLFILLHVYSVSISNLHCMLHLHLKHTPIIIK